MGSVNWQQNPYIKLILCPTTSINMVNNQNTVNKDIWKASDYWNYTNNLNRLWLTSKLEASKNKLHGTPSVGLCSGAALCCDVPGCPLPHWEAVVGQDVPSVTSWGWRKLDLGSTVGAVLLGCPIWATPHPLLCNVQPRLSSGFFCSFAIAPQHIFCLSCLIKFFCNIHKFKMGLKIPNNICCVTYISGSVWQSLFIWCYGSSP